VHVHPRWLPGSRHVFQGRGPGGREPDQENATYVAFGHGEPGLDGYGLAAGPGNGSGRTFRRAVLAELRE